MIPKWIKQLYTNVLSCNRAIEDLTVIRHKNMNGDLEAHVYPVWFSDSIIVERSRKTTVQEFINQLKEQSGNDS